MSYLYRARFVALGSDEQQARIREKYPDAVVFKGTAYARIKFDKDFPPGYPPFTAELSEEYGEAFQFFEDGMTDQMYYEHSRDGKVVRALHYDTMEYGWSRIEGEPEAWEAELLFSDDKLRWALNCVCCETKEEEAALVEKLRNMWNERKLEIGFNQPSYVEGMCHVIANHFGFQIWK